MAGRKPGPDGSKSEMVNMRLSPRARYALELLARQRHCTYAGVFDWLLEEATRNPKHGITDRDGQLVFDVLWNTNPAVRLCELHETAPHLMNFEDQQRWEVIELHAPFRAEEAFLKSGVFIVAQWPTGVFIDIIKDYWEIIVAVAAGKAPRSKLPSLSELKRKYGVMGDGTTLPKIDKA